MKTIEEMIAVMTAFKEGKAIQQYANGIWYDCKYPNWDWLESDYRIKPEETEPKYRPYTLDELFSMILKNRLLVKRKGQIEVLLLTSVNKYGITAGCEFYNNKKAFEELEFIDGTPFGIRMYMEK